ncbi:nucleotidyltransferase [Anaerosacchariphilus polymeriproducens]|uniref:tRNA(Met) cytidine acetate ligase n=1 Tax=Anaerosacchariphilus polymeriproducens TaxID=1812858 RepID=A0A371ATN8_9FIRM|nr:nucleotidyltransferase [Anaerosacchariphilus polymeriproducens]RDU22899.1 nucleotidyltransferase [Anaerosacchariphilus polymeriproducens]
MNTVGIIAEYNPFHNGHLYHIQKAKELTQSQYAIIIMSGNFVQRGAPAIIDKFSRTRMALENGADIVIELPVIYASGSAESFAYGSVSILDALNCVDYLCFGSECGQIKSLQEIAEILVKEPTDYLIKLKTFLKNGLSYPLARQKAIEDYLFSNNNISFNTSKEELNEILSNPNNILGIEYCKALLKLSSYIKPITISRLDSGYHSTELGTHFSSASSIRKHILESKNLDFLDSQVPNTSFRLLKENRNKTYPIVSNDLSDLLYYKLHMDKDLGLEQFLDVSPALSNRILGSLSKYENFDQFCNLLKSKEMTYTRICRCLIHVLLNLKTAASHNSFVNSVEVPYARILGINKSASKLLTKIKENSSTPMITKLSSQTDALSELGKKMIQQDIFASQIYQGIVSSKFKTQPYNEYKTELEFYN